MDIRDMVKLETTNGEPVTAHGYTVTPQVQALSIRLPFGGYVLNRPVAVLVEQDGRTQRLPILDLTRITQFLIWALALGAGILFWRRGR